MKSRHYSIMLVSFALVVGFTPMVVSATAVRGASARFQMAASEASSPHRDAYLQIRRAEVREWRFRLDKFVDGAAMEPQEARKSAAANLNKAWSKTSDAAARLETASAEDWGSAKGSFKKASDELAAAWSKAVAEAK